MQHPSRSLLLLAFMCCLFHFNTPLSAETNLLVEAESFADRGGWTIDQQSMDQMGSPYLLAHGLGTPVDDATTTVKLAKPGTYRVFVRTKDWVARWKAPGTPGKFQLLVNGTPLAETFGTKGAEWTWHDGGTIQLDREAVTLTLRDLTGFAGRCDAILFTDDLDFTPPAELKPLAAFRQKTLEMPSEPDDGGDYDLVVTGGGLAGCCAAVSAARLGLDVVLIQDRPILGGNSSSEVRVWIGGGYRLPPYPNIGEVVAEMFTRPAECPGPAKDYGDDVKLKVVEAEKRLTLKLSEHVNQVETDAGRITAVVSQNIETGRRTRFTGRHFVDATGDGTVGFLAGADFDVTEKGHMGATNLWAPKETDAPVAFPKCPWALDLSDKPFPNELKRLGRWFWESGFDLDTVRDAEAIRDHNFRAMYGAWDCLKNTKGLYPNHRLAWAAAISGKRESRRLLGDVILTKEDVMEGRDFPDGCVSSTWSIDLHYPHKQYVAASPDNPFLSVAQFTRFKKNPYPVPYRCLYSRNVPNLLMAGRDISVTHEALGTVRVMATCGLMGEVVGRAAAICKRNACDPREVYTEHLDAFIELLKTPTKVHVLKAPAFADAVGENLARKARITSSSNANPKSQPIERINDGQADTHQNASRWLSSVGLPVSIEFEFDGPKQITAVRAITGFASRGNLSAPIADFVLEYSDGDTWRAIPETLTEGNEKSDWQCRFTPVAAKRFRLKITDVEGNIARIWEIALYATAN